MIRVEEKPEYPQFNVEVRQPGLALLAGCPHPTSAEFNKHNYWNRARTELHAAYNKVCAYTCIYLLDPGTVDHFLPKSVYPELAYEWCNFRLARSRFNTSKGHNTDIMDPFEIQNGWFTLDLPSCLIKPNPDLSVIHRKRINTTINTLRLNDDDYYVQERCDILIEYAKGEITFDFLKRRYPFLAEELTRQDIIHTVGEFFGIPA